MPIRVKCEKCKKTLSAKDALAGKKIKCPVCQNIVLVTAAAPPAGDAAPPQAPPDAPKPAVATKPVKTAKPPTDVAKTNGTPAKPDTNGKTPDAKKPASNGAPAKPPTRATTPAAKKPVSNTPPAAKKPAEPPAPPPKPPEPPTVERGADEAEAEALAAFAEELKPPEDDTPKTIDFSCPWCEMALHLPLEQGGKQQQCPNEECRRIIKVPMPVAQKKGDWREMSKRRGPAGAMINQPEALDDAWGTEEATRVRQSSLAEAGAIEEPERPAIGFIGWALRGVMALGAFVALIVVLIIGARLSGSKQQTNAIKELTELVKADPTKGETAEPIIKGPLLQAEAHLALGMLWLRTAERRTQEKVLENFIGAQGLAKANVTKEDDAINEQMLLAEIAVARIEYAGTIDQFNADKVWEKITEGLRGNLSAQAIPAPEVQVFAMRDVADRLIEKKKPDIAIKLADALGNPSADGKRPLVYSQYIALQFMKDHEETKKKTPDPTRIKDLDLPVRVGYAEGYARKQQWDDAFKLVTFEGPHKDRIEACLGVAAVALRDPKTKAEATRFLDKARELAKEKPPEPWQVLQLIRLGMRTDDDSSYRSLVELLPNAKFKLRAEVEIVHAKCDKASGPLTPEILSEVEKLDKKAADANEDTTETSTSLALAWVILTRHNARKGASRAANRAMFENHIRIVDQHKELLRPMVDVGTYLGQPK